MTGRSRSRRDDGSALMLVPAAVLVLLLLAAIAIDSAVVLLAQRELMNRTAAAANDIGGFAASEEAFYRRGEIRLSAEEAERYTALAFPREHPPPGYRSWGARAVVSNRTVRVEATADVAYIFAGVLPGLPDTTRVRAASEVTTRGG